MWLICREREKREFLVHKGWERQRKRERKKTGTRLECRLQDHRLAGRQKNLKAEYTPKPNILGLSVH